MSDDCQPHKVSVADEVMSNADQAEEGFGQIRAPVGEATTSENKEDQTVMEVSSCVLHENSSEKDQHKLGASREPSLNFDDVDVNAPMEVTTYHESGEGPPSTYEQPVVDRVSPEANFEMAKNASEQVTIRDEEIEIIPSKMESDNVRVSNVGLKRKLGDPQFNGKSKEDLRVVLFRLHDELDNFTRRMLELEMSFTSG